MANRPFRKPNGTLTPRQDAFAREFLADLNASAAARRAGFSAKTAGRQAIALLTKPHVLARIQQPQAERVKRVEVNADWVMQRLMAELEANVRDLYDDAGVLKNPKAWPQVWQKELVTSIRTIELFEKDSAGRSVVIGHMKDITLADRGKRIELLGKHISVQAFKERVTVDAQNPLQALFDQIKGTAIRPAIEAQSNRTEPEPKQPALLFSPKGSAP